MAIDPTNPKKSKKELPADRLKRPAKAALNYQEMVRMRELILAELIEDLGGNVTITPDLLFLCEKRCSNIIASGLDYKNVADFLED